MHSVARSCLCTSQKPHDFNFVRFSAMAATNDKPHSFGWDTVSSERALQFASRRSPVLVPPGGAMCASTQPLATDIGLDIIKAGGNAMDAAVAMAAALNVTEPTSTGIGGDCFCLYFDATTGQVHGLNGSGRAPAALSLEVGQAASAADDAHTTKNALPPRSAHTVTVPGAAAGWCDAQAAWGSLPLATVLAPAIQLAQHGFPVSEITANSWTAQGDLLRAANGVHLAPGAVDGAPFSGEGAVCPGHAQCPFLRADGSTPATGDIMQNMDLADTFRSLGQQGAAAFYTGRIADSILQAVQERGGVMQAEDLATHSSTRVQPLSVKFHGVSVHEIPPNGQGIVALMALQYMQYMQWPDGKQPAHNSPLYINALVQALRLAFADGRAHVSDETCAQVTPEQMLSDAYASERAALIQPHKQMPVPEGGWPIACSDTVSFQTVDGAGNAVSFINSNYMGFGTGIVPKGTGFTLQNRGAGFSLEAGHPNALAPGKRPYHTIIPGMVTQGGSLFATFSVMGGFMQPQGHAQVVSNMVAYSMDAQSALDAARVCLPAGSADSPLAVEDGIPLEALQELLPEAHLVKSWERSVFGRGQIIRRLATGVLQGGSDGRGDGCAAGCGPASIRQPSSVE